MTPNASNACLFGIALCLLAGVSSAHAAATEENFRARTTGDLLALCSVDQRDPLATPAIHFCHGFAAGAYQVLREIQAAQPSSRLFCVPNPPPSRNEAIAAFVQWLRANPDQMSLPAADGVAHFLARQFPCAATR